MFRMWRRNAVLDHAHGAPIAYRMAHEGRHRGARVGDIRGVKSEPADYAVEPAQRRLDLAGKRGLVNDAARAARDPTDESRKYRRGWLVSDDCTVLSGEHLACDTPCTAELCDHPGLGVRKHHGGLDRDAPAGKTIADDLAQRFDAAGLIAMNDLQHAHWSARSVRQRDRGRSG